MIHTGKLSKHEPRLVPTLMLGVIVLLASYMGATYGGYSVSEWAPVTFVLLVLALIASLAGALSGMASRWSTTALGLFAAYAVWTLASVLWSPNRGEAWLGAGQGLLYLLVFWLAVQCVSLGASRAWVMVASAIGSAIVAVLTLPALLSRADELFHDNHLMGTVGYRSGEAAFLLVPLWVAVYLAGSVRINPILRGLILAGATLCIELAVLTQSRGAMVGMIVSLPIFFLISGQRLRGFFALTPIVLAVLVTFPVLNGVYLASLNQEPISAVIEQVLPIVWLTTAAAGLYGLLWGLLDRRWELTSSATRLLGGLALACGLTVLAFGWTAASEQAGDPLTWAEQRWEAFKSDDATGQEQSRFLAASGSGRYTMWQVAWEDFKSHPLLGVGTHNYEATYYQLREKDVGNLRQPHSLPLEVLSERGIVGGILFFGFLATCLGAGLWERFRNLGSEGKGQVGALVAAVAYWFVYSSGEWFWQLPAVTLPAMVYLAMLVGPWQRHEALPPVRWHSRLIAAGIVVLLAAYVAPLYVADRYLEQSHSTTERSEAVAAVKRAQQFNPLNPVLYQREGELAVQAGNWERAESTLQRALRLNPEHYAQYVYLAQLQEARGDPTTALSLYRKALDLNPLDPNLNQKVAELGSTEPG